MAFDRKVRVFLEVIPQGGGAAQGGVLPAGGVGVAAAGSGVGAAATRAGAGGRDALSRLRREEERVAAMSSPDAIQRKAVLGERQQQVSRAVKVADAQQKFGSVGAAAQGFNNLLAEAGEAGAVFGPAAIAIGAVVAVGVGLTKAMIGLAAAANPRAYERTQKAMADVTAVAGRVFVPILTLSEKGFRLIGDALASILPTEAEMEQAFRALDPIFQDLRDIASGVAPLLHELGDVGLQVLADGLKIAAVGVRLFLSPVVQLIKLMERAGILESRDLATSVGASGGQGKASFSSVEEFSRQANLAAFGSNAVNNPQKETNDKLDKANALHEATVSGLKAIADLLTGNPVRGGVNGIHAIRRAIDGFTG